MTIYWNDLSHLRSDRAVTCLDSVLQAPIAVTTAARQVRWVGADPESDANECPAVAVMPETGDFLFRGKAVTDPAVIAALNQHIGKADDESDRAACPHGLSHPPSPRRVRTAQARPRTAHAR